MNQLLNSGEKVQMLSTELSCEVGAFLGGGGQGEVYRARLVDGQGAGAPVALKWFFPHYLRQDSELRTRLEHAIDTGPPSDRFLWPQELVQTADRPGFGYVMPLREDRFVGITDLVTRRAEPTLRALVTAGFDLAHNYRQLHAKGFCYRDISFGNVFFDPESGEVRICDNDNVSVDGQGGVIGGTTRFMAPEIVRAEAGSSIQTDLFSLAVLLFYMLVNHHPLEGAREAQIRCFDLPAMTRLYGTDPLFIFDPNDSRNQPLPGHHDNALALWPLYPRFVQALFIHAFTDGLRDAQSRVRESQWRSELIRLRDAIFYCQRCGAESFYDLAAVRAANGRPADCWSCASSHRLPPRLRIDRDLVMLNHDTLLYPHHLDAERSYSFDAPVAEVTQHPQDPQIWGLRNRSAQKWVSQDGRGQINDVEPGKTVTLSSGLRIQFGSREGEVRF
jgi:DNA-binding helix-hairpin-helix protein with protein kinase domain